MTVTRRHFACAALAVAAALPFASLAQGAYPAKPITVVVSYPPGGDTDAIARLFAEKLSASA
jgi:tripartite-type tricarboxylate transporter receptor subunit TctC